MASYHSEFRVASNRGTREARGLEKRQGVGQEDLEVGPPPFLVAGPVLALPTPGDPGVAMEEARTMRILGILLVVVGLIGVIWGGISWTQQEQVADIGPLEISTEERESLPIPPIAGAICLIAGTVLLVTSKK